MTQDECLASPHHFTHLGVCSPGSVAYVQLFSANDPKPATFSVQSAPEPGAFALLAIGLVVLGMNRAYRRAIRS